MAAAVETSAMSFHVMAKPDLPQRRFWNFGKFASIVPNSWKSQENLSCCWIRLLVWGGRKQASVPNLLWMISGEIAHLKCSPPNAATWSNLDVNIRYQDPSSKLWTRCWSFGAHQIRGTTWIAVAKCEHVSDLISQNDVFQKCYGIS
jgi:hypothetical protein